MSKLMNIGFFIVLIAFQPQKCTAFLGALLGHSSSVVTVGVFLADITQELFDGPKTMDETLHAVSEMHSEVVNDLDNISEMLENLPNIIDIALKKYNLGEKMNNLKEMFEEAVAIKIRVKNKEKEDKRIYEDFGKKSQHLDEYFNGIYHIITADLKSLSDLIVDGRTELQAYKSFCQTGVSEVQLLDNLFRLLRISMAQYFITKTLMYNFLDLYNNEPIYGGRRDALKEHVSKKYERAATILKTAMSSASRELWTCNTNSVIDSGSYAHLNAFSQYIFSESDHVGPFKKCDNNKCHTIKRLNSCTYNVCKSTRPCRNEFASCQSLTTYKDDYVICIDNDPASGARYTGIIKKDEKKLRNFYCSPDNTKMTIASEHGGYANILGYKCDYCNCICRESIYYVSLNPALARVAENRIVTGARLSMKENTLYIEIQEGKLLANGSIDSSTSSWSGMGAGKPKKRFPVSWSVLRSFDLTQTVLPSDRVVTGLQFDMKFIKSSMSFRTRLEVYSARFDFRTGKLIDGKEDQQKLHSPAPANKELRLSNLDVPTRSEPRKNYPDSEDNQFLKLTTSSLEKDGGQSTIPFIDTQSVTSKYLAPLSGAGLVHRAQKGFGGFLALKLHNYDIKPYIEDRINFVELDAASEILKV